MTIFLPFLNTIPDPPYLKLLKDKRVLFDVGTLLRGILFPASHSNKILQHIKATPNCKAIISPHIRNRAIEILELLLPQRKQDFVTKLLELINGRHLEVVSDGRPDNLPLSILYDPEDDDIIMATALDANCDLLSTLDADLASHASEIINIIPPSDIERSAMFDFRIKGTIEGSAIFAGPDEGSIAVEFSLNPGVFEYNSRKKERKYVFHTDEGFGLWINTKTWKCQIGFINVSDPTYTFGKVNLERPTMISVSYDCKKDFICVGLNQENISEEPIIWRSNHFKVNIFGHKVLIGGPTPDSILPMHIQGILSTRKSVEEKALKYSLLTKSHFEPLDCQRFPLKDIIMDQALIITPEANLACNMDRIFR